MPRGYLKEKEYKAADFEAYVCSKAKRKKLTLEELANILNCDRSTLYRKLKNGSLTYKELLQLFKTLEATGDEIAKLLIL